MLLVDETDKADVEVEGLLLEVLSDFQVTIPELGTLVARAPPVRGADLERDARADRGAQAPLPLPAPGLPGRRAGAGDRAGAGARRSAEQLAEQVVRTVRALRAMELKKAPSIAETIDWARTLVALGLDTLDADAVRTTLGVVLKHASDAARATTELKLN